MCVWWVFPPHTARLAKGDETVEQEVARFEGLLLVLSQVLGLSTTQVAIALFADGIRSWEKFKADVITYAEIIERRAE